MATNDTVVLYFKLSDLGETINSSHKNLKAFKGTFDALQRDMDKAGSKSGGGWKRAAMGDMDYGTARGTAGQTGAAGRDFGKQAQGLGGLVRLYATYAANIFAVSAAFRALSDAMDTDRMIRGLDQLSASSGIAMGGLAKQFSAASGGAISLRESMEATAKAISSGLSTKQFMELGTVAKGVSQALGVNMSDAVSRLTRGITKLEPELLDELGIFTKVGKASEDYARSVNKSVDSLTDFEKRQAFANAVLAEGQAKFGAIAAEGNPYDKLLAELKNTAQQILSVVNSIVTPIAKLLSDNTALIGAAIALSALKITRQALPALLSWRKGLADAAADAAKRASEINSSFGEAFVERYQGKFELPQIQATLADTKAEYAEKAKLFLKEQNALDKNSAISKAIASGQIASTKQLASWQAEVTKKSADTNVQVQRHVAGLQVLIALQQRMNLLAKQELDIHSKIEDVSSAKPGYFSETAQRERVVRSERSRVARMSELSNVNDLVAEKGIVPGLKEFYSDVNANKDLTRFDKLRTKGVGTFVGIATAVHILTKSLSGAFFWIELATATFLVLDTVFGKNSKQIGTLNDSLNMLVESTKTATDVNEKYLNTLSVESINARANAFTTLADGIKKANRDLISADETASWFDRNVKDNIKVIWGGDIRSQFTAGITDTILGAIDAAPAGEMRNSLQTKLREVTGVDILTRGNLSDAFSGLSPEEVKKLGSSVSAVLDSANNSLKQAQVVTQNIKEAEKAVKDSFLTLKNSVSDRSPVTQFFQSSIKQAYALEMALKDVYGAGIALQAISKGEISTAFLDPKQAMAIQPLADETAVLMSETQKYTDRLEAARTKLVDIDALYTRLVKGGFETSEKAKGIKSQGDALRDIIKASKEGLDSVNQRVVDIANQAKTLIRESIVKQIDDSMAQTQKRLRQISIQSQQNVLSKMPENTVSKINEEAKLQLESLAIERDLTKSQENLVRSIDLLTLQIKKEQDLRQVESLNAREARGEQLDPILKKRRTQLELSIAETDKATQAYGARDLKTLTDLAKQNPALQTLLPGATGMLESQAKYAAGVKQVELNRRIGIVDVGFADQRAELQRKQQTIQGIQSDSTIKDNIIAQNALARVLEDLREQESRLPKEQAKAQLDVIDKFAKEFPGAASVAQATREKLQSTTAAETGVRTGVTDIAESNRQIQERLAITKELYSVDSANRLVAENNLKLTEQATISQNALTREKISRDLDIGKIGQDQADAARLNLDLIDAEIQKNQALRKAQEDLIEATQKYALERIALGGQTNATLEAEKDRYQSTYLAAVTGANDAYNAQKKLLEFQNEIQDRQKNYENSFKQMFKGMEDAIINFVKTGKLSFKDMINSFIEELLRYEIKQQQIALFSGFGGVGGITKMFMSSLGMSTSGTSFSTGITGDVGQISYALSPPKLAKGGAYDAGLKTFAKGGMFTNSIVNQPTLFKFARGTGLMGEAGPEAIMPLKRDSQGNLGVRAGSGGGNVDVVVNNYSNTKATAKETTDSRGNRRIEVIVGDMVAGELNRPGSSTQQAMTASYGTLPLVARR